MNKAVRFVAATGLLTLAYVSVPQAEISLSLWIATALLFAITVFLEDRWQFLAVLLSLPLVFLLYNSGNRDALTLVVFSLISVLSSRKLAFGIWALAAVMFLIEGFFNAWHLNTLPFLFLGLGITYAKEEKPQFFMPARATLQEALLAADKNDTFQLKREIAFLKGQLEQERASSSKSDAERLGREINEITGNLSLLLFEIGSLLDEGILEHMPAFDDLKIQLTKLQRAVPLAFSETFFTDSLSTILNQTAIEKKAVFHLKLKKMDLSVAEKFVLNELTKSLVEDHKEYEISLAEGEEGLFYVVRPTDKKKLDERIEKLVEGIDGSVIFGDGNAYLIWRTETDENTLNSTS